MEKSIPLSADRYSLLDPPPEMDATADLLSEAVDALLVGEVERAGHLLQQANIPSLWAYADRAMNPPRGLRITRAASAAVPVLPKTDRAAMRMPSAAQERSIYKRDGYRCRYCGSRVVLKQARSILTSCLPAFVPWPSGPRGDKDKHAAFYALNSVIDHVVPHSRGGDSSQENLVTSCWPCNFFKEDALLEEVGLADPRSRPPVIDSWDGLERIVKAGHRLRNSGSMGARDALVMAEPTDARHRARASATKGLEEWIRPIESRTTVLAQQLRDLLQSLEGPNVRLSIGSVALVNVTVNQHTVAVLGIDRAGNVDVPWLIGQHKELFKPFALDLANAIPFAKFYETRTMWRVDGTGATRGQISIEELVAVSDVLREAVARFVRALERDLHVI